MKNLCIEPIDLSSAFLNEFQADFFFFFVYTIHVLNNT
jgi:hypothetical protein